MVLGGGPRGSLEARAAEGGELTPVMARLGPVDLETLDALITAGIAASRAEAVRWALARIRERPHMHSCASEPARSKGSRPSLTRDRRLDLVTGMAACAAAGDLLDDGARAGGALAPVMQDPVLAVLDDDSDDLPAVGGKPRDLRASWCCQ